MRNTLFVLLSFALHPCCSQDFSVQRIESSQGKINIYYDLLDSVAGRSYTLNVYSSKDNFLAPLTQVEGDAGLEVKPGAKKKIVWNAVNELGPEFDGKISLEVRGKVYVPFVRFERFEEYKALKRGRTYSINWTGGSTQNILHFELYKGNKKVGVNFTDVANTGKYKMVLPTNVKPGSNYRFKISDTKNKDEIVYTGDFKIKRKVPLVFKVIPVLAVGAAIYILAGSESKTNSRIPDPVEPN
jgi:hypothetical protein